MLKNIMDRVYGRRDLLFLFLAWGLNVFLRCCYMSGLYYDQDAAYIAGMTSVFLLKAQNLHHFLLGIIPPGINFIYALSFLLFGESFTSVQIMSLAFNLVGIYLLYIFAKNILKPVSRFYFLLPLLYALFSACEALQGHTSNPETFFAPLEIGAILCLGLGVQKKRVLLFAASGSLLGLALFIKQAVLVTAAAAALFLLFFKMIDRESPRVFLKKLAAFACGFLLPVLLAALCLIFLGLWRHFIQMKFQLVLGYMGNIADIKKVYLSWGLQTLYKTLKFEIAFFGLLALAGLGQCLFGSKKWERLLALCWFAIPVLVLPLYGFHFRHHFIQILAPSLTLAVIGLCAVYEKMPWKRTAIGLLTALLTVPFFHIVFPLIKKDKLQNSFLLTERYLRSADKEKYAALLLNEQFDAARRFLAAQYVRQHTKKNDQLFVWDDIAGDSIYVWAQRKGTYLYPKSAFLPKMLNVPVAISFAKPGDPRFKLQRQKVLDLILHDPPAYVILVKSYIMIPHAPLTPSQTFSYEQTAFKEFFDLLQEHYTPDTQLYDIIILKRVK